MPRHGRNQGTRDTSVVIAQQPSTVPPSTSSDSDTAPRCSGSSHHAMSTIRLWCSTYQGNTDAFAHGSQRNGRFSSTCAQPRMLHSADQT